MEEKKEDFLNALNKMANDILGPCLRQPRYRFWQDKNKNRYCWTTEKTRNSKNNRQQFASWVYRYFKTKKRWVLKKQVFHAKRTKAKDRAWRMYDKTLSKK